jgi:hypothetical protein
MAIIRQTLNILANAADLDQLYCLIEVILAILSLRKLCFTRLAYIEAGCIFMCIYRAIILKHYYI